MIFGKKLVGQLGTLLQNNNISTSCNFPNLKTFIQNEQTMEADRKKHAKTVCTYK